MKTSITTFATMLIMFVSFNSFATEKINPLKDYKSANVINAYLEATTLGSTDLNKFLFTEDFEYRNTSNNGVFNKKQYTTFLKENKNIQFNCETTYTILDENGDASLAKATLQFENFTRVDYITLVRSQDGWKVSKVVTTYP